MSVEAAIFEWAFTPTLIEESAWDLVQGLLVLTNQLIFNVACSVEV